MRRISNNTNTSTTTERKNGSTTTRGCDKAREVEGVARGIVLLAEGVLDARSSSSTVAERDDAAAPARPRETRAEGPSLACHSAERVELDTAARVEVAAARVARVEEAAQVRERCTRSTRGRKGVHALCLAKRVEGTCTQPQLRTTHRAHDAARLHARNGLTQDGCGLLKRVRCRVQHVLHNCGCERLAVGTVCCDVAQRHCVGAAERVAQQCCRQSALHHTLVVANLCRVHLR